MDTTLTYNALMADQDKRIAETVARVTNEVSFTLARIRHRLMRECSGQG
jgi:hypothetical protein